MGENVFDLLKIGESTLKRLRLTLAVLLFAVGSTIFASTIVGQGVLSTLPKGSPAPQFSVESISGTALDLAQLKGKVVVLNFWFIACPPCRVEMPKLNSLVEQFEGKGVVFIGFSPDSPDELREFLADHTFKYEVIPDSTPIAMEFKVTGAPTHIIIDREGNVSYVLHGAVEDVQADLSSRIEALLG